MVLKKLIALQLLEEAILQFTSLGTSVYNTTSINRPYKLIFSCHPMCIIFQTSVKTV